MTESLTKDPKVLLRESRAFSDSIIQDQRREAPTSKTESNRDKVLRGEVVKVTDDRLREMQEQARRMMGVGDTEYHWHWSAVINELIARRAVETTAVPALPMRMNEPWSLPEVLAKLIEATEHSLDVHSCDTHGYELFRAAANAGRSILREWQNSAVESTEQRPRSLAEEAHTLGRQQPSKLHDAGSNPAVDAISDMCPACAGAPNAKHTGDCSAVKAEEPTPKPARDADHCDYPDCEQHNTLVIERMRHHLRKLGWEYNEGNDSLIRSAEPSADGLTKVRDRTANVALTCSGACRYSNGVLIADPACDTHGSAQKAEEPELCPRCQQSMPSGVALHTDHCPQEKATERRCDVCQVVNVHELSNCAGCGHELQPLNGDGKQT